METKFDFAAHEALRIGLQEMDRIRRERVLKEEQEREWPSVVLEDLLDAEEVKERTRYPVNPIIGLTNVI